MQEVVHVLWEYASRYCLEGCYGIDARQNREECANMVSRNWEALEKACPPDVFQRVAALCDGWEELRGWDMEAAFVCGFHLGASLR